MRSILALLAALLVAVPAEACSFCASSLQTRLTLREHFAQARVVVHGKLANPKLDPATDNGTTELHLETILKTEPALAGLKMLILPRYLPVIGDTPRDHVIFGSVKNGVIDPTHGVPATPAMVAYLKSTATLDPKDSAARLAFFFRHLDANDEGVASDAFVEFARAPDTEIFAAAKHFDPAKLRRLISNPATPVERIGVLAFVLGTCGTRDDAAFLGGLVKQEPLPERTSPALGGLLAGYILLAPRDGWDHAVSVLGNDKRPYADRLSVMGTVRFFQASRPKETRDSVLRCCAALLPHGDLADQAIEDLRRWGWWDLTPQVLAQWGEPTHSAPIVKRSLVRYALSCATPEAKEFVAAIRKTDAKLVDSVAESLAAFETIPPR